MDNSIAFHIVLKGAAQMPRSMTGYGRSKKQFGSREITVELKSVNHKFFEFNTRLPRQYAFMEDKLKSLCGEYISRGKVEMYVNVAVSDGSDVSVGVNAALAKSYICAVRAANEDLGLADDITLTQLFRIPDVFNVTKTDADESELWDQTSQTAEEALVSFVEMRASEGERLKNDILSKLRYIEDVVTKIEARSPMVTEAYRQKLYNKLLLLLDDRGVDEARVLTEAAIFADKTAVDEETVRLKSHIASFRELLERDEPIGKKLDFLIQEMNREVNTTGSKCSDLEITKMVVDLKSTIEKIREQIQNIE